MVSNSDKVSSKLDQLEVYVTKSNREAYIIGDISNIQRSLIIACWVVIFLLVVGLYIWMIYRHAINSPVIEYQDKSVETREAENLPLAEL